MDNESHITIDPDFLINGNVGDIFCNQTSENQARQVNAARDSNQEQDSSQRSNVDLISTANLEDIQMKMTRRPLSGVTAPRPVKKQSKKTKLQQILNREQASIQS